MYRVILYSHLLQMKLIQILILQAIFSRKQMLIGDELKIPQMSDLAIQMIPL